MKKKLIELVLTSFDSERQMDIQKGLELVSEDYKMTDMMISNDGKTLFPSISAADARAMMNEVYQIKERKYRFVNVVAEAEKGVVVVEFVETYPDPQTGQLYCTPQVAICEVVEGKIRRTRHYMDPRTTFLPETPIKLDEALI